MDIGFLLWLQEVRTTAGPAFEQAVYLFTAAALVVGPITLAVLYWCFDRKAGIAGFLTLACGQTVNNLLKVTACIYRPWVKSPLVQPSSLAVDGATGYSLPSGHTMTAATTLGAVAWQRRSRRWVVIACTVLILLCAGSRNLLGVHTPQDVAAALAESLVLVLVCAKAAPALEDASPRAQTAALVAVLAFCALAIAYVTLKPYPFDLVDGVPLVDPEEMRLDAYKGVGFLAGIAVAWFAERRLVCFEDPTSRRQRLVRLALGVVVTAATYLASLFISLAVPDAVGAFLRGAAPMLGGVFLAPAAFSRLERALEHRAA